MYQSIYRMLETNIFDTLSEGLDIDVSLSSAILMIIISFICGFIISFTYMKTSENGKYAKNFALTMVLLPAVISSIIMLIGSDIATAFSLAGAFAIIRFRSEPGEPKDIAYVLFAMAAGLSLGIGELTYAIIFTIVLCVSMYILSKTNYGTSKVEYRQLKITIPEDLNYEQEFPEVFEKYEIEYHIRKVSTASLGSLYQVYYDIKVKEEVNTRDLLDDLRIRNSNLDISLTLKAI